MSVSTHVLDAVLGRPAAGMAVRLVGPDGAVLATGTTDADGRYRLLEGIGVAGDHRVVFGTGEWFAAAGRETFYPSVTLDFTVIDPATHHHVPLLLSPFAFSTYRGS